MSVSPSDLLACANNLAASGEEVNNRSAISRAYYAMLHHTIASCPIGVVSGHVSNSHEQVIGAIDRIAKNPGTRRSAARELLILIRKNKKLRVKADYYLDKDIGADLCSTVLIDAQRAFDLINSPACRD